MTAADIDGLMLAVREDPDDDGLRHILGDLLEDSDRHTEASLVRGMMRFAKMPKCDSLGKPRNAWCRCDYCRTYDECCGLATSIGYGFDKPVASGVLPWFDWSEWSIDMLGIWRGLPEVWAVKDVPTFESQAKEVFGLHPIRRVVLRDHTPRESGSMPRRFYAIPSFTGLRERPEWLRDAVYSKFTRRVITIRVFYSSADAVNATSTACVNRGRHLAKLPPLKELARKEHP
jgi:uncharacterized protein (TIGR02996 family)